MLINENWTKQWPNGKYEVFIGTTSDYVAFDSESAQQNKELKTFQSFNSWCKCNDYMNLVNGLWNGQIN